MGQALLIFNPARPHSPMFSAQEKKKNPTIALLPGKFVQHITLQ